MDNILEVNNLCKNYNNFALKNINFTLPKGMIMGFIGENGAGKTTTIKAILNLIKKNAGEIKIFGLDNIKNEQKIKEDIGVVLDESFFPEILTPKDINKIMKNIYHNWDTNLFEKYLQQFSLDINQKIKTYSKGMKKKLEIITAISHHPKLLILDEPTSGLDPIARKEILDLFQNFIQDEENSILFSTHITTDLESIADYITFINEGEIKLTTTCDEILNNYGIVKCNQETFLKIAKTDYLKFIKNKYDYELLVANKDNFKRKYDNIIIDKITLDELMFLMIKGEK